MPLIKVLLGAFVVVVLLCCSNGEQAPVEESAEKLKALIIDGQNNHPIWPKTTMMMKSYLEETGLFETDVVRTKYTWQGPHNAGFQARSKRDSLLELYRLPGVRYVSLDSARTDPDFKPDFMKYDLVVSNFGWKTAPWTEDTKEGLRSFVASGGGLVIIHAANNAFGEWDDYNRMIGLGGWGGRDQATGPYVYYDDQGQLVRDTSSGPCGAHGNESEFLINVRDTSHPITAGMPPTWMHATDELYERLRGPGLEMHVLATAYADPVLQTPPWAPDSPGSGRHEPMLLAIGYDEGRVFHTPLGHADYSMECVGFITAFQRGAEWAATGTVTQEIPLDFPTDLVVRTRSWSD